jgi:hypothetical protein
LLITTPESKRIAVDVTVVSPTQADNREGAAAIRAERAKDHLPYGDPERARFVRDAKIDFFGVALETHGTMGPNMQRLVQTLSRCVDKETRMYPPPLDPQR